MKVLFQDKEVQKLLDDFQKLVGVRIAVFDTAFNELYSSPKNMSNFCHSVRQNDFINKACQYCDQKAFMLAKVNRNTYIYPCHLGLYEAVTPIYDNEQILGYVMIGQVLDDASTYEEKWHRVHLLYGDYANTFDSYEKEFRELKQMSMSEIEAVSNIMKACASSIWYQQLIDIERSPVTEKIERYIENHYAENLSTPDLCEALGTSKTTVYNYLKQEHGMSLTQYLNHYRLLKSKELLKTENTSIANIALEVGFEDYNYFSRIFKKAFGQTPKQYQKKYREA